MGNAVAVSPSKYQWAVARRDIPPDDPVWRRFGRDHEKPCRDPSVLTCAMPECQYANQCQNHKQR
jgi:hypothetical protein